MVRRKSGEARAIPGRTMPGTAESPGKTWAPAGTTNDEIAIMPGTVLGNRYVIDHHLGAGGMGTVYAARDRLLGMPVALKFVRPELARNPREQDRLRREVQLAHTISHPSVVRTFTLDQQAGHVFIVMELLDGCSLADRLQQGPLPPSEALRITRSVLGGLAAAHA